MGNCMYGFLIDTVAFGKRMKKNEQLVKKSCTVNLDGCVKKSEPDFSSAL